MSSARRYSATQRTKENGKRPLFTGAIRLLANQRQRTKNLCSFQRNLLSLGAMEKREGGSAMCLQLHILIYLFIFILNFRLTHHSSPPRGALSILEQEKGGWQIGTPLAPFTPHVQRYVLYTICVHTAYRIMSIPLVFPSSSDFTKLLYYFILSSPHSLRVARWPWPRPNNSKPAV